MRRRHLMPFGAELTKDGVRFVLWAPSASAVTVVNGARRHPMTASGQGWFKWTDAEAKAGDLYGFAIGDTGVAVPDPASRYQPSDADQRSQVVDPGDFTWTDSAWQGRPWSEAVICEVHVGTATPEGNFAGLTGKLDHFKETGVTAIQLMPVAQTPGRRTWGYDGVLPYAPNNAYGTPGELKALIDGAHARGLMIFLDVVYNHFGPSGNFLPVYAEHFFTSRHQTPWGAGFNFDGLTEGDAVREFFIQNALYWLEEYHFDGLRFDAVHTIIDSSDRHFLEEIAGRIRSAFPYRAIHLILENENNEASRLIRGGDGEALEFDAQWNDDIHHCWHRLLTGETDGYYADYGGDTIQRLGRSLTEGFCYQGEFSLHFERKRGEKTNGLPPQAFVAFLQNHDQIGNRAQGDRLNASAGDAKLPLARALLLLSPQIPMIFMGEEWGATTPFQYFVDFENDKELEQSIRAGRTREFAGFTGYKAGLSPLPDPAAAGTFLGSKLDWPQAGSRPFAEILGETRGLLTLRRDVVIPLIKSGFIDASFERSGTGGLIVNWRFDDGTLRLAVNFDTAPLQAKVKPGETVLWQSSGIKPGKVLTLGAWSGAVFVNARESELE
jgi:maltooligosyltrehalose trehalohydrolase